MKKLHYLLMTLAVTAFLSGCAAPKPTLPSGERVAINPPATETISDTNKDL